MTDDERAIRNLVATWMEASRKGDIEAVLSLMADDVVFMVAGQEPFGKETFAAMSRSMANVHMQGTSDIREVVVFGDFAYLRNYLTLTVTLPDGTTIKRAGYTLTVVRKVQGRWLLARDANLMTTIA